MKAFNLQSKLSAYSAMAASFIALQTEGDAQVIYTDLIPDHTLTSLGPLDTMHLDIDGDNITDFIFNASFSYSSYASADNYHHLWISGQNGDRIAYSIQSTNIYTFSSALFLNASANMAKPFNIGNQIGASQNFINVAYLFFLDCYPAMFSSVSDYCWNAGLPNNTTKYIGFRLKSGVLKYYGWMRLFVDNIPAVYAHPTSITVLDYAYNATPNTPIIAGNMVVCLPPVPFDFATATTTSAKIGWSAAESVDHYELQYRTPGGVWHNKNVPGVKTNVKLTGLTCNTPYEWHIRTSCVAGDVSSFSEIESFTTAPCRAGNTFDIDAENINIYSNNNLLFVNIDEEIYQAPILTVYNNVGQIVLQTEILNSENVFELNAPSGIYMVNVLSGNTRVLKSVMIQN